MLKVVLLLTPVVTMARNSVYLDGAFRGFAHDAELNSYSFDHHGDGPRFPLMASCQQVMQAIRLGADLADKDVFVSSIDADSVLSTMLVLDNELAKDKDFSAFVREVSQVDAGGPAAADPGFGLKIFSWARPERGEEMSTEVLMRLVELGFEKYRDGSIYARSAPFRVPCTAVTLTDGGSILWRMEGDFNFSDVYDHGRFGFLHGDKITIGKLPFARVGNLQTLWPFLSTHFSIGKWGGADAIGGSPFKREGALPTVDELIEAIQKWVLES